MIGWVLLGMYLLMFLVLLLSVHRAPLRCGWCEGSGIEADGTACHVCVSHHDTGH